MPFLDRAAAGALLAAGLFLAAGNLWITHARSTIPRALDALLVEKRLVPEKKTGVDDVCLLVLADGRTVQVDRFVFDAVREGERLQKAAGSKDLRHGDRILPLSSSPDLRGMLFVMPAAALAFLLLATASRRNAANPPAS